MNLEQISQEVDTLLQKTPKDLDILEYKPFLQALFGLRFRENVDFDGLILPVIHDLQSFCRALYILQVYGYQEPVFLRRDFRFVASVLGLDNESITDILFQIRAAPKPSSYSEAQLSQAMFAPVLQIWNQFLSGKLPSYGEFQLFILWLIYHRDCVAKITEGKDQLEKTGKIWIERLMKRDLEQILFAWEKLFSDGGSVTLESKSQDLFLLEPKKTQETESFLQKETDTRPVLENYEFIHEEKTGFTRMSFHFPEDHEAGLWLGGASLVILVCIGLLLEYAFFGFSLGLLCFGVIYFQCLRRFEVVIESETTMTLITDDVPKTVAFEDVLRIEDLGKGYRFVFKDTSIGSFIIDDSFSQYNALKTLLCSAVFKEKIVSRL